MMKSGLKQQGIVLLNIILVSVVVIGALLYVISLSNNTQSQVNLSLIEKRAEYALVAAVNIGQQKLIDRPNLCPSDFIFPQAAGTLSDFEVTYQCVDSTRMRLASVRVHKGELFSQEYVSKTYQF